jgi:hypothetical protein
MYLHVAIQTCPVESPVVESNIYGLTGLARASRLQLTRVPHIGMASLAKVRHLCLQKGGAGRAVGRMTGEAVLHNGRVLPQVGPTHIGMALKALKVAVLRAYQSIRQRAVGVVAIRTLHFAFPYGMMGLSQELGLYPFMTLGAHLRFSGF